MKSILTLLFGVFFIFSLGCEWQGRSASKINNPLSIKDLVGSPKLDGETPIQLKISPDGKRVSFLKGKKDDHTILDLWQYNLKTGKPELLVDSEKILGDFSKEISAEEKARRERKRIHQTGIVEYQWSKQGDKLLFPIGGDVYLYYVDSDKPVLKVTNTEEFEIDPRFSPEGNYVSFVRESNLFIVRLKDMKEIQVSFSGTKKNPMAVAEFVAQEEMGRYRGYWWSDDEKHIAMTRVDNSKVSEIQRFEVSPEKIKVITQTYPRAGTENAIVELGVIDVSKLKPAKELGPLQKKVIPKNQIHWVSIPEENFYIPKVLWHPSGGLLSFTTQSRDQKTYKLWTYDLKAKKSRFIYEEKDRAWIDVGLEYQFLKNKKQILWMSEKSGYSHIHLLSLEGKDLGAVTKGDWEVLEIHKVDEEKNKIYFSASKDSVLENHFYIADLKAGGESKKISQESGNHKVLMSKKSDFYIDYNSTSEKPPSVAVHGLGGQRRFFISENKVSGVHPLAKFSGDLSNWEYHKFQPKEEGAKELHYRILKPKNFSNKKKYPVVHYVYGGPGVQLVRNQWSKQNLFHQLLAQRGFVVIISDNRGTPNRGRDFEREFYLKFGRVEVEDQSRIMEVALKKFNYLDKGRVGVYGHSYGGYLSLMLLFQRPDIYHVGVSGAPVVDWTFYDTHYTERYLGDPKENEAFYLKANVTTYVNNFKGRALIVHGMADDNVLYNHSLILYQELQSKGKIFDIMLYPGAKHGIRGKKEWKIHYSRTILEYFSDHLIQGI